MKAFTKDDIPLEKISYGPRTDRQKKLARINYVIHTLHMKPYIIQKPDDYYNLSSYWMGAVFTTRNKWIAAKNELIDLGIIECDGKWNKGSKCLGYRITDKYRHGNWKVSEIPIDHPNPPKKQVLPHVSIDLEEAERLLPLTNHNRKGEPLSHDYKQILDHCIHNFRNDFTVGKTGRIFTYANFFPEKMRQSILINDNQSIEIDVKNSQPLLLGTLYDGESERSKYLDLVQGGMFYEDLMQFLGQTNRGQMKDDFFHWIFGSGKGPINDWFQDRFPKLNARIQMMRQKHYKALVFHLQETENKCVRLACTVPHLSIHDGLRIAEGDEQQAIDDVMKAFAKINLTPKIVTK